MSPKQIISLLELCLSKVRGPAKTERVRFIQLFPRVNYMPMLQERNGKNSRRNQINVLERQKSSTYPRFQNQDLSDSTFLTWNVMCYFMSEIEV